MGTPINPLEKSYFDLTQSPHDEDKLLAQETLLLVDDLARQLRPLLKYITTRDVSGNYTVGLAESPKAFGGWVVLTRDGQWGKYSKCRESFELQINSDAWKEYPLSTLIDSLHLVLKRSGEAREKHLASIREAQDKLAKIRAILKS